MKMKATKQNRRRFFEYLFTIFIVVSLNFALPRLMPGDPFLYLSADNGEEIARFSQAQIKAYRQQYGLDKPWPAQYAASLCALLHGDLGYSIYYNKEVSTILINRRARPPISGSWVTMTIVWPLRFSSSSKSISSFELVVSSAPVGSSARITSPPFISARATETRCC